MICDLDGDGLKDLVLMDDLNLSIFYQDPKRGFTREPQQTYRLEPRPCLVWAARLGGPAESLLVMTSDGVTELCFTNRTGPPAIRQIIRQPTVVPAAAESTNAIFVPLSVETGGDGGGQVHLVVSDTGIGIPPEELPHIFEEFYRGEAAKAAVQHGTGLGMTIVKRVVDLHGGRIDVESRPGQGTTFRVTLPGGAA